MEALCSSLPALSPLPAQPPYLAGERMHVHVHVHVCVCVCVWERMHVHVCMCMCMCACVHVCMCACVRARVRVREIRWFHTTRLVCATQFRDARVPHTQTQRYGILAMTIRP